MKNDCEIEGIKGFYKMNKDNVEKYAECAALAYNKYPLFEYIMGKKSSYKMLKAILAPSFASVKDSVLGISNNENADAVAIFAPPKYKGSKFIPFMLNGGIKLMFIAPPSTFLRLMKYENHTMKLKKQYTNHESWYLYNVTVKPECQNNGYCSELLKPMFKYFDENGQDCYLETHSDLNIPLYEHYGFELLEANNIPRTKVKHYAMIRRANQNNK